LEGWLLSLLMPYYEHVDQHSNFEICDIQSFTTLIINKNHDNVVDVHATQRDHDEGIFVAVYVCMYVLCMNSCLYIMLLVFVIFI